MLDRLAPGVGSRKPRKRVGRGIGSGSGKTCGRGQKGAGARSGFKRRPWFEGGQMPLARRLPKRGFTNTFRQPYQVVNLKELERFDRGSAVDAETLSRAGLVARPDRRVKILGEGEIAHALKLQVDAVSAAARTKIEAAGGSIEIVATRRRRSAVGVRGKGGGS